MKYDEKVAVVTGAAKGIGAATAAHFLANGASVVRLDVESGFETAAPEGSMSIRCDVSVGQQVAEAFEQIGAQFEAIDFLINNAGIQRYGTVTSTTEEEWDEVMNVNLKSAFLCAKHAIPLMSRETGGVIVNVSSVQAFLTQANVAHYATSKTAMLGLTRSIAIDFAPRIRCVAVCPGTVDTPMVAETARLTGDPEALYREVGEMHLLQRIAKPEEIANMIGFLCSEEAAFCTGQTYRVDGGLGIKAGGTVNA